MSVKELNRGQLTALKQQYLADKQGRVSWGELANADSLVSDAEIFEIFGGFRFTPEDF